MFNDEKLIKEIIDIVSKERMILETQSGLGMYDDNKNWEVVICHLLNVVYGYELINLNDEKMNYPGIDLGDKKRGLGVQVTSTKKSRKIGESLKKVYENRVYEMYPKFKIFILGKKQKKYSVDTESYKEKMSFDIKADVLDFDDLLREIKQIDVEKKEEILEYLKKMFGDKREAEVANISRESEGTIEKKEVSLKKIVNVGVIEGIVGLLLFSVAIIANIDSGDILFRGWSLGWLLSLMGVGYVLGGVLLISFLVDMIKTCRLTKRGSFVEMQLKTELLRLIFGAFSRSNDTDNERTRNTGKCYKNIDGKIFLIQGKQCLLCESEPIGKMYLRYSNKKNSYFWECSENHEHISQFDYKKKI